MKKISLVLAVTVSLAAGAARAQNAIIDFQGYSYETGGFPTSDPNDVLRIVGIVDDLDSRFGVNLASEEVTLFVDNLISTGQADLGGGLLSIAYTGGDIDLYRDGAMDHDFGINPPNATAPSTFVNGSLFLGGTLSDFFLFLDTNSGTGAYEGNVQFTSGSGLAALGQLNADGYTFGGVLNSAASGGNVPQGYDLQVDGVIEVEVIVGVEQRSWGAVKELFKGSR